MRVSIILAFFLLCVLRAELYIVIQIIMQLHDAVVVAAGRCDCCNWSLRLLQLVAAVVATGCCCCCNWSLLLLQLMAAVVATGRCSCLQLIVAVFATGRCSCCN